MAVLTASQVKTILVVGQGQVVESLELSNVTTADTVDVGSLGTTAFKKVEAAVFFGRAQGTGVVGSPSGTVITMTIAGLANDTVEMLIIGEA